jgi:hypothetical protein
MAAANPQASAAQIRSAILSTAVPVASLAGKVATGGLLNAAAAVQAIAGVQPPVDPPSEPPPPPPVADLFEPNDSLATATPLTLVDRRATVTAVIGDGRNLAADVDLFAVSLAAGQSLTVDIDAATLAEPSTLDSFLRLFDASGTPLAANDDAAGSLDSLLTFVAPATGTYYVGVSAFGNSVYDPAVDGSGQVAGSSGAYVATFVVTPPPVVADVIDVSPDPRTTSVEAVLVQFSREVTGFDRGDLVLTRDGRAVALDGVTVTTTDGVRWTVAGLAVATASAGSYVLTLNAAGSGIEAADGGALASVATDAWTVTAPTLVDAGDTLATAAVISATTGDLRLAGRIGDGAWGSRDVDLYRVRLAAGQRLVIDIDARSLSGSSTLDSYLRVFDSQGRQQAANDDFSGSLDSYLAFTARTAGSYFVGVSGYGNSAYNASRAGSGRAGSTGVYQVSFGFGAVPSRGGSVRAAGFRDTAASAARHAAFATYGTNWFAALPAAAVGSNRRK